MLRRVDWYLPTFRTWIYDTEDEGTNFLRNIRNYSNEHGITSQKNLIYTFVGGLQEVLTFLLAPC
jgi:hypothetical protein